MIGDDLFSEFNNVASGSPILHTARNPLEGSIDFVRRHCRIGLDDPRCTPSTKIITEGIETVRVLDPLESNASYMGRHCDQLEALA